MLVKCNWITCKSNNRGMCMKEAISLESFDYDEDEEEKEGLKCSDYQYHTDWVIK